MARLSEQEKARLLAGARRKTPRPPPAPALPIERFMDFATRASRLIPVSTKPVRFGGTKWKL